MAVSHKGLVSESLVCHIAELVHELQHEQCASNSNQRHEMGLSGDTQAIPKGAKLQAYHVCNDNKQ